jgi:hypothetical protein
MRRVLQSTSEVPAGAPACAYTLARRLINNATRVADLLRCAFGLDMYLLCTCCCCCCCRAHFVKITATPEASAVRSRRDGVMWLWRVHNEVNARLAQVRQAEGLVCSNSSGSFGGVK